MIVLGELGENVNCIKVAKMRYILSEFQNFTLCL